MPDTRSHRGPDPRDEEAFGPPAVPALRAAVGHLSWLLEEGYAITSALKLVGDRWSLTERQRMAVRRSSCSDAARARRDAHQAEPEDVRGQPIAIDGFNVLTTVEAALAGAVILRGRDGVDRDLAGVHGTYRKVEETRPALELLGAQLDALGVASVLWLLDSPVSNSGRLRAVLLEAASDARRAWRVDLVFNPDTLLARSDEVVATADAAILDRCALWLNLARLTIASHVPDARIIDLSLPS